MTETGRGGASVVALPPSTPTGAVLTTIWPGGAVTTPSSGGASGTGGSVVGTVRRGL